MLHASPPTATGAGIPAPARAARRRNSLKFRLSPRPDRPHRLQQLPPAPSRRRAAAPPAPGFEILHHGLGAGSVSNDEERTKNGSGMAIARSRPAGRRRRVPHALYQRKPGPDPRPSVDGEAADHPEGPDDARAGVRAERDHPRPERRMTPTTEVTGISRWRIQTLPFIMNGLGRSGSEMRSQMIAA